MGYRRLAEGDGASQAHAIREVPGHPDPERVTGTQHGCEGFVLVVSPDLDQIVSRGDLVPHDSFRVRRIGKPDDKVDEGMRLGLDLRSGSVQGRTQ